MSNPTSIPDVLADRYASPAMAEIWSARGRIVLEREFWIAVMKAQRELGLEIPAEAIEAYERAKECVDFASIRARERVTRHDVKARIEEFCALAGHQHIHKGLTSRDLTESVEQLQVLRALRLVRWKTIAALNALAQRAREHRALALTARTHNVPAQVTTVGRRLAMFGTEMLHALRRLDGVLEDYPFRGLKGAVGTQLDLLTLFDGDLAKVLDLEDRISRLLGFPSLLTAVGQVYPRSVDFEVVSAVFQVAAGPSSFAKTLRLMAGNELASEGSRAGQVGSSAMPHKVNSRSCERINALKVILSGYLSMVAEIAGDQWNEGDVSCSAVRRVALPGAMMAIDGLLETFLTVVREMEVFPRSIEAERLRQLPFLATTTILMSAVRGGAGREVAHAAIREHALAVANSVRSGGAPEDLIARLAADERIGLTEPELRELLASDERFIGAALEQTDRFLAEVEAVLKSAPEAASYLPSDIL